MTAATAAITRFANRREAGRALAAALRAYGVDRHVVVLALPRGGVPVGYEIARALHAPLDVFVVRKLGVPQQPELAMGALATGDVLVTDARVVLWAGVTPEMLDEARRKAAVEVHTQEAAFRGGRPGVDVGGRIVIVVDDGLATGATMRAAVQALRKLGPARVIVAVPVGALESCEAVESIADELVCLSRPSPFDAVGLWYDDFSQTTDAEVTALLNDTSPAPVRPGDDQC